MSKKKWKNYIGRNIKVVNGLKIRTCSTCKMEKPLTTEHYHRSPRTISGFAAACKTCNYEKVKKYRKTEIGKAKRIESRIRNIETEKKYKRQSLLKRRELENIKRKHNATYALKNRVRILMYHSLRKTKSSRRWIDLVGYSIDDLRKRIEVQFDKDMSWERFMAGDIHIDHIIPVSAFNYTKPEDIDFKRCWALSNLQPLWKEDNLKKNAKMHKQFQPSLLL